MRLATDGLSVQRLMDRFLPFQRLYGVLTQGHVYFSLQTPYTSVCPLLYRFMNP